MSAASNFSAIPSEGDSPAESPRRRTPRKPVASIYVHAGAGYHSLMNERIHLQACTDAARIAMSFLKAGATAPQAVEAAIRCLEDKEITNSGYGSNLNIHGVVECDATIVDHLGRSGACGAVAGVKNPITLAKTILDTSSQPLSLRRVPPNILVGPGATEFAEEHSLKTVRNEFLVSRNAKDRYLRWSEDLKKAETKRRLKTTFFDNHAATRRTPSPSAYDKAASPSNNAQLRDHTSAILTGTWNEGQPDSPGRSPIDDHGFFSTAPTTPTPVQRFAPPKTPERYLTNAASEPLQSHKGSPSLPVESTAKPPYLAPVSSSSPSGSDGLRSFDSTETCPADAFDYSEAYGIGSPSDTTTSTNPTMLNLPLPNHPDDMVTDTVGAIAIDLYGNISAGSSSGGIGMKHRGRTGPAALVGVGTAVVPEDPDDDLATSVAAVTSGTGEHMATCLASGKCAERLFQGTRRGPGGRDIAEEDEHAIMESFITDDFMNHPGVRDQPTDGAIGIMAVKKDRTGAYFYFAHNTDSFALASMASTEKEPLCVMSRLGKTGRVALGGRKVRLE
ncbi:nucleophile aminohydrolase [Chaetomium sp. MPI-SDFR-AT-0129]|nr:nucleophile aminohydrolase [Chaetomium sp. MPI-SDFR-AT-0129]